MGWMKALFQRTESPTEPLGAETEKDNALRHFNEGMMWRERQGFAEAVKCFTKAAELGLADAQYYLARSYQNGEGIPQNFAAAAKWYRKAAGQGHAVAQCDIGYLYARGLGVFPDHAKAVTWFRAAAEQGHAGGQCNLGRCYYSGTGVSKDFGQAVGWFRKAAAQGHADSQCLLGAMYDTGAGIPEDHAEAAKWYHEAAKQGDAAAQFALAECHHRGRGVPQSFSEAIQWYGKAAEQGDADAAKLRDLVASELKATSSQNLEIGVISSGVAPREEWMAARAKSPLDQEDEQLAQRLLPLIRTANSLYGKDQEGFDKTRSEIREIGEFLCSNGGSDKMLLVAHRVQVLGGKIRDLEYYWQYIGGWLF